MRSSFKDKSIAGGAPKRTIDIDVSSLERASQNTHTRTTIEVSERETERDGDEEEDVRGGKEEEEAPEKNVIVSDGGGSYLYSPSYLDW